MKKTISTFALLACVSLTAILFSTERAAAQFGSLGATVGLAMPLGTFGDGAGMGFGAIASGRYFFNDNFAIGLNFGYDKFGAKNNDGLSESIIPISGTAEYYIGDTKLKPYFGFDAGVGLISLTETINIPGLGSQSASASETGIYLASVVGVKYSISDNLNFLANLKYNIVSKNGMAGYLGINAGISYSFGK